MGPDLSPGERLAHQLAACTGFLRWAAAFPAESVQRHPERDGVMCLSPLQSSRFSFALAGSTLYWGLQSCEAEWAAWLPLDRAWVTDRVYLAVAGINGMGTRLSPLTISLFVDDPDKRARMAQASQLQRVRVEAQAGRIVATGQRIGAPCPVTAAPAATDVLRDATSERPAARFL
ncbi:hypothetical protein [Tahibacter amnicola]|uniref:Uncharacterized protein n=1 Tax=Tahibacter amnicola TaxID=2976241 RepID=A0ABY6BFP8_9GAMM|nr:hypothetical protein [Tahibacter amnicola]UXI68347.1 hypothetical protein N4264_01465 [Tahibacter amnicola]